MKLTKLLIYSSLFILFLTFSSCFEVIEEVDLNSDGSGSITFTLNMSQSKSKLASIMLLDSVNGVKVPSRKDIQNGINDVVEELKKAKGISNIKKTEDYENFIFSVKCDFKDIENINNIVEESLSRQKNKTTFSSFFFDTSKGTFKRNYKYSPELKRQYNKLKEENKKVFQDASYTVIYRFDKEVSSQSNTEAKISKSKKAIMHRVKALDIINGNGNFSNQIQLKK